MSDSAQHVVPSQGGMWGVRKTGSQRVTRVFATHAAAVQFARAAAKKQGLDLFVHAKDGTIRSVDSFMRSFSLRRRAKKASKVRFKAVRRKRK